MENLNPKVDFYFTKDQNWHNEFSKLRTIVLSCGLTEELKWGCACYTKEGSNIVLIHGFKEYCALLFFKGALLQDTHKILIRQSENVQSPRQIRFTNIEEIEAQENMLKAYIHQAIEVEKAGLKLESIKPTDLVYPEEFKQKLAENPALKTAFEALTPGRQRAYNLHFSAPKLSKTRLARVEHCMEAILKGKGLNDDRGVL